MLFTLRESLSCGEALLPPRRDSCRRLWMAQKSLDMGVETARRSACATNQSEQHWD